MTQGPPRGPRPNHFNQPTGKPEQKLSYSVVGAIIGAIQLLLIPVSIYFWIQLGFGLTKGWIFIWGLLNFAICGPIVVIASLPKAFSFLLGPPHLRKKWLLLQMSAWIATIFMLSLSSAIIMHFFYKDLVEAVVFSAFGCIVMGIGFYLIAMAQMPAEFFDQDMMGIKIKKFLGCQTSDGVAIRCILGAIAFFFIGLGIIATPVAVFN